MKVIFGEIEEEVPLSTIKEIFESYEKFYYAEQPHQWEKIPKDFQERFQSAFYLKTHHFTESGNKFRFSAEWDNLESYSFRDRVIWFARTNYAIIRGKHLGNPWLITVEGGWSIAPRLSQAIFGKRGKISLMNVPSEVLREILKIDSKKEKKMKWKHVEEGLDGMLQGVLPKNTGTRSRFDKTGEPVFAEFESRSLRRALTISCRDGYLSSKTLTSEELIDYYEQMILPKLPRSINQT